ncbi:BCCT family transporter [Streptomyces sp. NPDC048272]|uniref:BCCT family transporter n=1 Tax=Streptomyces sp. NPDC048272 TaxID=3154616 RepID=UPI003425E90B
MSADSLEQPRPDPPGAGPADPGGGTPDLQVVAIGVLAVLAVVAWAALGGDSFDTASSTALAWVLANFAWLFVIAADVFLVLCVVLALSRFGRIRLGADDSEPEFTNLSWIAMMFSAGMGIGLMFYGVGEPLTHFLHPPPASGAAPGTGAAARAALDYSFFHWTLTPWAIYGIAGLALAYATFRKGRGNRLSSAFVPLIGERRADGPLGRTIDLLAVFATVFGTATSLGLGALQVAQGLELTAGVEDSTTVQLIVIGSLSAAFVLSAFSGLHKGVKWLSTINLVLAAVLMLFVFVLGPTVYILDVIPASVGGYLHDLLPLATGTGAFTDSAWLGALPLGTVTSWVAMVLVMTYFVTSADSASLVMGSLTSRGSLNPPTWLVVTWGILMAGVAAALLLAGGLKSLQTATILVALPFVLVMLLLCWALVKELREDPGAGPARTHPHHGMRDAVKAMVGDAVTEQGRTGHHRLKRVAESKGRDRADGQGGTSGT